MWQTGNLERPTSRLIRSLSEALAAQTEGHYSLFEGRHLAGGGLPLHRHQKDGEGFYVLAGRYPFQLGDEQVELVPGDFLHVPRPTPHAFEALEFSRALVIVAPGGFHERYFEDGWELIDDVHNPLPTRAGCPTCRRGSAGGRHGDARARTPPARLTGHDR